MIQATSQEPVFDSGHSLILESSESNGSSLKSAAMLGIALSVGASGALIPSPDAAVAANAPVSSTTTEAFSSDTATQAAAAKVEAGAQQIASYHTIASGESLWQIAQQHGVGLQDLRSANALSPEASISVGQVLKVPASALPSPSTLARTQPVKMASAATNSLSDVTARPLDATEVASGITSDASKGTESVIATLEMSERSAVKIAEAPTESVQSESVQPAVSESAQPVITAYAPAHSSYRVQSGDTLRSIASSLGTTPEALVRANSLIDPDVIFVGSTLVVPADAVPAQPLLKKAAPTAEASQPRPAIANSDRLSRLRSMATTPESANLLEQMRSATPTAAVSVGGEELTEQDVLGSVSSTEGQDPYASNLLAEVEEIKTQSVQVSEAESVELKSDVAESEEETLLARAGDSDRVSRLNLPGREPVSAKVAEAENSLQADRAEVDPDLLAAAPLSPDTYIPAQRSTGQVVSPDMPLLPSEDEYLPEAPDYFDGYIWPTEGTITSGFGWRWGRMHRGVDVAGPIGTPVVAAASGVVERAGWTSGGYGNIVEIRHPDGSMTRYAHNNSVIVSAGQSVKQGQQIAEMGSTGYSTGPHLHFEIYLDDDAVNPVAYLPSR